MSIKSIILDGGIDLSRSPQEAAPGSLRDCLNFEVGNKRGYQKMEGIRAYSGGVSVDITDPYVLHSFGEYAGACLDNLTGFGSGSSTSEGFVITWGSGGNFNVKTQSLSAVDGYASVCLFRKASATLVLYAIYNIVGRLPTIGDVITNPYGTFSARVFSEPRLASQIVEGSIAAFGTQYATASAPIDGAVQLINDFRSGPSPNTAIAYPLPANPNGGIGGQFYFNDKLHLIVDIETWNFTDGSEQPSEGDTLFIYYDDAHPSGDAYSYTVDKVTVTSGSWGGGDAAGTIQVIQNISVAAKGTVIAPTDVFNETTNTDSPFVLTSLARSKEAALYVEEGASLVTLNAGSLYVRQDLGHEVRFTAGDNYPTVLNRVKRDASLEAAAPTVVTAGAALGSGNWSSPTNAQGTPDASVATDPNDSGPGRTLRLTDYGFNLPENAVVLGVKVTITKQLTAGGMGEGARDYDIRLLGVDNSQNKKRSDLWPAGLTAVEYGGDSDLWGGGLSAAIVNSPEFGVSIRAESVNGAGARTRQVDSAVIEVTYKDRSSVVYFGDASTTAITSIMSVSTTATVMTTAAHGFVTGQTVNISGATQTEYNGNYVITVTGTSTFTYTFAGSGTSPATGTKLAFRVHSTGRIIWYHKEKGDWSTNDAVGTMTVYELSDPDAVSVGQIIRAAESSSSQTFATVASAAKKVTLAATPALEENASRWETEQANFFASIGTEQVFGVSGAGLAFSWDGRYLIQIRTGIEENQDRPRHVTKHLDQLLLGYQQGTVMASDLGYPESFAGVPGGTLGGSSPISDDQVTYPTFAGGAQEIPTGDSVYGLIPLTQQSTGVGCRHSIQQIVGTGGALVASLIKRDSGIIEYTLKDIGIPVFCDHRGIGTIETTDAFGDFQRGRLSDYIADWLIPRLQQTGGNQVSSIGPVSAEVIRNKNQYRVYFRDRFCLTMTMTGNGFGAPQFTFQQLPFVPLSTCTGVTSGGRDVFFLSPPGAANAGEFSNILSGAYRADSDYVPNANIYIPSFVYRGDVGVTWDEVLGIDSFIEINGGAAGREWEVQHYDKMVVHGQCYGFAPFGARFAVNFEPIGSGTPQNVNGGSMAGSANLAFAPRPFSKVEKIRTSAGSDGYALTVQFVASGSLLYGATSTQTAPYKFRPFTIQSIILISETLKTRPPHAGS